MELVDDELVYTPEEGYNGPDDFEYSVIDGNGFISDAPVDIMVVPVNDAPVASELYSWNLSIYCVKTCTISFCYKGLTSHHFTCHIFLN